MRLVMKRMGIVVSILVVLGSIAYLAFGNFKENLVYFVTPREVVALPPSDYGKKIRVAGMVVKKSLQMVPNTLKIKFDITDGLKTIPVIFEGIPPDLFKEGQGAVVEGVWMEDQTFHSKVIMAKHSEDYMPIEMKRAGIELPKKDFYKTLQVQ